MKTIGTVGKIGARMLPIKAVLMIVYYAMSSP